MRDISIDGPREKIINKGVASLSTAELLQVIIGSGNGHMSMARIARKTLKLLAKKQSSVTYDELLSIPGLGPARACQILVIFEIASRYTPVISRKLLNTAEKSLNAIKDVSLASQPSVCVAMLDGGFGHIATRLFHINNKHPTEMLRSIFLDIIKDKADKLIVGIGCSDRSLTPSLYDLSFARYLYSMSKLFKVSVKDLFIVNAISEYRFSNEGIKYG